MERSGQASPGPAFAFAQDLSTWPLFTGQGPLPGITSAQLDGACGLGAWVLVRSTDGRQDHAVLEVFEPRRRYVIRMELTPPVSHRFATIEEDVRLERVEGGTRIVRTSAWVPPGWWRWPLAWSRGALLRPRAVARHDAADRAAVA